MKQTNVTLGVVKPRKKARKCKKASEEERKCKQENCKNSSYKQCEKAANNVQELLKFRRQEGKNK